MSLILDALNRAEQERKNQDKIPDFTSVHTISVNDSFGSKKKSLLFILLAIVAIAILIVVVFLGKKLNDKQKDTLLQQVAPQQAIPQQASSIQSPIVETPRLEALPIEKSSVQETTPAQPSITTSNQLVDGLSVDSLYEAQTSTQTPAPTDSPVTAIVDDLYAVEKGTQSTAIVEPFATIAGAPVDQVVEEPLNLPPPRTFESITNVPDFNQLAWNFKQQIPTISYSRHNYVGSGIRSVVINGQVLGVGNVSTSSQLVIEEIFVDGIVVRYRDTPFKLRALNGWINM